MLRELLAVTSLLIVYVPCARADASAAPDRLTPVDRICAQVMGLRPGETYFAACQESLSEALPVGVRPVAVVLEAGDDIKAGKSFYEVSPSVRWNRERDACAQIGLRPGSAVFHQCTAGLDGAFLMNPN